ncbi:carboxymuconolactone decarboxylase family protein [Polyangium sp. y55x31]|uniref:carboxymuconolactone decarboxylase family protein n=1 Tax=Polyangium sp. y55x31 TaxID=3042688 RepID=UPI002482F7CA|nr:carboxymuconolactone decarboxylase family protein [Polyangium sp. y55x31]MDI1479478.1 carboxymuconolactone decarboxylase family protein [Polyangium sp. y55x31]
MSAFEAIRAKLPDAARDTKLNLQSVLEGDSSLSRAQRLGIAIAAAANARSLPLREALVEQARAELENADAVIDDAYAAATLMAMNNVYYRFRYQIGKETYSQRSPKLRMNRIAQPKTSKADFELMSLAVSAMNGCEACVKSHEQAVLAGGLGEDHVHDAVRIAATIQAATVALEITGGAV